MMMLMSASWQGSVLVVVGRAVLLRSGFHPLSGDRKSLPGYAINT